MCYPTQPYQCATCLDHALPMLDATLTCHTNAQLPPALTCSAYASRYDAMPCLSHITQHPTTPNYAIALPHRTALCHGSTARRIALPRHNNAPPCPSEAALACASPMPYIALPRLHAAPTCCAYASRYFARQDPTTPLHGPTSPHNAATLPRMTIPPHCSAPFENGAVAGLCYDHPVFA